MFMEPKRKPGMSTFDKIVMEMKWLVWWLACLALFLTGVWIFLNGLAVVLN